MANVIAQPAHSVATGVVDGHRTCTLASRAAELAVTFAPDLGMVACSMRHAGEELLGARGGLAEYARTGATMGIPLLHPWANRLGGAVYSFAGRTVAIAGGTPLDEHGLPIHGLLRAVHDWSQTGCGADDDAAWLSGELRVGPGSPAAVGFPFPHVVEVTATLRGRALAIATTVRPTGDVAVPISFGYHPYLRLPGVPRADWRVELPAMRRLALDARSIPTGASEPVPPLRGPLGRRTFDDGFALADGGRTFVLAGGGRRIEVRFDAGYPYAQVFAPPDDDVVCFEPMTAPTDALRACFTPPPAVAPGGRYGARFTIAVERAA